MPKKGLKSFQINLNFPIQNISIWLLVERAQTHTELAQNCFTLSFSLEALKLDENFSHFNFISTESFRVPFFIYILRDQKVSILQCM